MTDDRDPTHGDGIARVHEWWVALTQPFHADGKPRRIDAGAVARLRRAQSFIDILFEAPAVELIRRVGRDNDAYHQELIGRLAALLAHVRHDDPGHRIAARLGGREPELRLLSAIRFKRLLQADSLDERMTAMRRAIQMLDGRANVLDLTRSWILLAYESSRDKMRSQWMIAYVGGLSPTSSTTNAVDALPIGVDTEEPDEMA